MKSRHRSHDRLHHLGLAANGVGAKRCRRNRVFGSLVVLADNAENNERHRKQTTKGNQSAALGLEKIEEISWFHGWPLGERIGRTGTLVTMIAGGGGGDSRCTSTVNWFFRDNSLRPPSGVPVTAK